MAKVKILIVEDEMIVADHLATTLNILGYEALPPAINYTEAIAILEDHKPDLAMLDIQLAGSKDGIDLAWKIREDYDIPFIFLSSFADAHTIDRVKRLNPPAYLVKPFNRDDLFTSIELALYNYEDKKVQKSADQEDFIVKGAIFVRHKSRFDKVVLNDILFIKAEHVYVELHLINGQKFLIRNSLTNLAAKLPAEFFRTHRSYAVNLNHLDSINSINITIADNIIPIGKNYRDDLLARIQIE